MPPASMYSMRESDLSCKRLRTTELFPKTLCNLDFLARNCEAGLEAGLYHSQLYVLNPWEAPPPFLAEQLTHKRGSYRLNVESQPKLEGVDFLRSVSLTHAVDP